MAQTIARGETLVGKRFGRWLVTEEVDPIGYLKRYSCLCDCGNVKVVPRSQLTGGNSNSCGCLRREVTIERSTKHGLSRSPEYKVYTSMVNRCSNPNYREFDLYGGRGIKVSEEWDTFEKFYASVGPRPGKGYQLDRKDNNKGYEPGNVRWATKVENARNKRNTVFVDFYGETITLKEVSERTGIPYSALFYRYQAGWTGDALFSKEKLTGKTSAPKLTA